MLILHYLIVKTNYVVFNFTCGMLWCVTISTSSCVSMIGLNEKNKHACTCNVGIWENKLAPLLFTA